MRYCDALAMALHVHGVHTMFGVLGDANMHYGDSFTRSPVCGQFVNCSHEGGGVLMAAGHAAVTGQVGVATVTHGAITNCVSALFDVARGGYPIVLICGDTARSQGDSLQNLPQRSVVAPTGARFVEVRRPEDVFADVARAFSSAASGRLPVVLNIPSDYQVRECEPSPYRVTCQRPAPGSPSRENLERAAAVIAASSRPVVVVGRGARGPDRTDHIGAFARRIGAPVATTLRGQGLLADDPFNLGVCGTLSSPAASRVITNCDCVVAFGASLNPLTSLKGELLAGKQIVQVDADANAFGKSFPVDVALVGDAQETAARLVGLVDELEVEPKEYRSESVRRSIVEWKERQRLTRGRPDSPLDIHDALHKIAMILPKERNLTVDVGRFAHVALKVLDVVDPLHYVHAASLGQIGLSMGYGIGAAAASTGRPTVVVVGDGGFMLGGLTEFSTAVRHSLDVVVFVMNDMAYGAEYYRLLPQQMNTDLVTFDWPSFADVANSLGGTGVTVTKLADLDAAEAIIEARTGPVLFDIRLDRDSIPEPGFR